MSNEPIFELRSHSRFGAYYCVNAHTGEIVSAWSDYMTAKKVVEDMNRGYREYK